MPDAHAVMLDLSISLGAPILEGLQRRHLGRLAMCDAAGCLPSSLSGIAALPCCDCRLTAAPPPIRCARLLARVCAGRLKKS